jgi:hypothetical protein
MASVSFAATEVDFDHGVLAHKYVMVGTPSESGLGQIAIEAIYHALLPGGSIKRVGYLNSSLLAPISGYLEESNGNKVLLHPAEVFFHSGQGIVFILLRSPCMPGTDLQFSHEFLRFLASFLHPTATLFLTGASREQWDLNPYQRHFFDIISEHSKARIESHFPGLFSLYDGSNSVNIRLPSLGHFTHPSIDTPDCASPTVPSGLSLEEKDRLISEFLRSPSHLLNTSDLTFPLGMSLTVALLFTLYFDRFSTADEEVDSLAGIREMSSVYGLFDQMGSPLVHGLHWAADLLVALQLLPQSSSETGERESKDTAQQLLQQHIPILWRQILADTM